MIEIFNGKHNLSVYQRDTYPLKFCLKFEDGTAFPLEGAFVYFAFSSAAETKTVEGVVADTEIGEILFTFAPTDFATVGRYYYTIYTISASGERLTHLSGDLIIRKSI